MIDFLGSDIHRVKELNVLKKVLNTDTLKEVFEKNVILNQTL